MRSSDKVYRLSHSTSALNKEIVFYSYLISKEYDKFWYNSRYPKGQKGTNIIWIKRKKICENLILEISIVAYHIVAYMVSCLKKNSSIFHVNHKKGVSVSNVWIFIIKTEWKQMIKKKICSNKCRLSHSAWHNACIESNLMRLFRVTRQFIGLSFICLSNAMCNWFATRKNEINCTYVRISLVNKVPIHSVKWMEIEHSNDAMMAEYTAIEVQALHYGWRETDTANAHHKWKTAYRNTNSNWSWQFSIRNLESGLSRAALPVGLWKTYKHAHKSK